MTKKHKNTKRIILIFAIALMISIAFMVTGAIKTRSYNQKHHMVAFEREDLFSAKFADSHEVAVMASARGST